MEWFSVIYVVFVAIVISLLFAYGFGRRGPWGSVWVFFLILFLGIWAASLWVTPIGPLWYGIAWIDVFVIGLLLAFLIAAVTEVGSRERQREKQGNEKVMISESRRKSSGIAFLGVFFWLFVVGAIVVIIAGLMQL